MILKDDWNRCTGEMVDKPPVPAKVSWVQVSNTPTERDADGKDANASHSASAMEAISAGASILTFLNLTAKTCKIATDITRRFRDAPDELRYLTKQLTLLHSELTFINELKDVSSDDNLTLLPSEIDNLHNALEVAAHVIVDVQKACNKYKQDGKITTYHRVAWVFHDQARMKDVLSRLQQVEMRVHSILLLLNVRIINLSRKAIACDSPLAITSNTILIANPSSIRSSVNKATEFGRPENVVLNCLATRDPHDQNVFWGSKSFLQESWLRLLGLQAVMSRYGNDYQTTYDFAGRLHFPLIGIWVLCLDLRLRRFPLAGLGLSFVYGGLSLKNVVPDDSPIMTACKRGDIVSVRRLFTTGRASPNDVTPSNSSPLRYAIENGSKDLVKLIINSGTNVNSPFGQFMTSPLEWAFASRQIEIARLFITMGARIDHISAKGWTPVFNLFGYKRLHGSEGTCDEWLDLLSAVSFSEYDVRDVDGWSVMHRAAAYGTSEDIKALIKHGCPCNLLTKLDWTPIRCAVRFRNTGTFTELSKYLPPSFVNDQDIRGWTILHEAAEMGSLEMLRLILEYGADLHIQSFPTAYLVPHGIVNVAATAADVARSKGTEAVRIFTESLHQIGLDVTHSCNSDDQGITTDDLFWPAE